MKLNFNKPMIDELVQKFKNKPEDLLEINKMHEEEIKQFKDAIELLNDKALKHMDLAKEQTNLDPWDDIMEANVLRAKCEVIQMRLDTIERRLLQGIDAHKILTETNC